MRGIGHRHGDIVDRHSFSKGAARHGEPEVCCAASTVYSEKLEDPHSAIAAKSRLRRWKGAFRVIDNTIALHLSLR